MRSGAQFHGSVARDLDARQRVAVTSDANPLAILAPAGSGKTRVLTRRIAWRVREGSAEPQHVLTLTFTRKAAAELIERLGALGVGRVHAGTFHSLALSQLRQRAVEEHRAPPTVLASKARLLGSIVDRGRDGRDGRGARVVTADLAAEIEWAKARMVDPDGYVDAVRTDGRRPERPPRETADLYRRYEQEKRRRRVLDFDDLLADLRGNDRRATRCSRPTQRWRFRQVFVDEFQDTTPLQLRLLRAWLGARARSLRRRRRRAGDLPVRRRRRHAAAPSSTATSPGATMLALDRNYRSTPQVVAFSEGVLGADDRARPAVRAARPDGPSPSIRGFADDDAEATAVAQGCWEAFTNGVPYDRIGVLFRTNAQSSLFEAALARRGIPSRTGTSSRFVERPIGAEVARGVARSRKGGCVARRAQSQLRHPARRLCDGATGATGASDDRRARRTRRAAMEAREHRDALLRLGREYLAVEPGGSVAGFSGWLDLATVAIGAANSAAMTAAAVPVLPSTCSRSTAPRASSGRSCSSPGSKPAWCRSRGRPATPTRSPRSAGCSTSRSAGPRACCTCRGRDSGRSVAGPRPGNRARG